MDQDFESWGRKLPYVVPEGFFEVSGRSLLARMEMDRRMRLRRRWGWAAGSVAVLLVLLGVGMLSDRTDPLQLETMYTYREDMSVEELGEIRDLIEGDVFLDLWSE